MGSRRVMVVGGSGFVGAAVVAALREAGHQTETLRAPRLDPLDAARVDAFVRRSLLVPHLAACISGFDAVVNAAGNPDAASPDERGLMAANGALPGVLAAACASAPGRVRFVHVSSAAVQGRTKRLDASDRTDAFSAYSRSKIVGEQAALRFAPGQVVVYRPPGVHAADRPTTQRLAQVAASPWSTVAGPGDRPTPQALRANVASAVTFLATTREPAPSVVTHPSEGVTTAALMQMLGGRQPRRVAAPLGRAVTALLFAGGRFLPSLSANARRVELMLFGQEQAASWLVEAGWEPPETEDAWWALGRNLRGEHNVTGTR